MPLDASRIRITSIRTIKGNINSEQEDLDRDPQRYEVECTPDLGVNIKDSLIRIIFKIDIYILDNAGQKSATNGSYTNEFIFAITDMADLITLKENDDVEVSPELSTTLLSLAFSTSRGMIYTRTQGTVLDGIILPVIDPTNLQKAFEKGR